MTKIIFLLTITTVWYAFMKAQNYENGDDPELVAKLRQLTEESNEKCLKEAAFIRANSHSKLEGIPQRPIDETDVVFRLYTRINPIIPQNFSASNYSALKNSNLNKNLLTLFFVHGLQETYEKEGVPIKNGALESRPLNVFLVDWQSYAFFNNSYTRNVTAPKLGRIVAEFVVKQLFIIGVDPGQIFLTGYSTGGQACGFAGKLISPKVGKIMAIDPAGPCLLHQPASNRLAETDGLCVIIIHCSAGSRGVPPSYTVGTDFIVNGGYYQPNCYRYRPNLDNVTLCSHRDCIQYFIDSTKNFHQFFGVSCPNYDEYLRNNCNYAKYSLGGFYASCSNKGYFFVDVAPLSHVNYKEMKAWE